MEESKERVEEEHENVVRQRKLKRRPSVPIELSESPSYLAEVFVWG